MVALLVIVFILVPIAELYVILQVGDAIGAPLTILLLVLDSLLGSLLLRSQGRTVWRQFNEVMAQGRVPHRELFDGIAVIFGGAFLITPGFLTDIVGILLLLPPTRAALRRFATGRIGRRFALLSFVAPGRRAGRAGRAARTRRSGGDGDVVEGTAREYRDEPPQGRIGP